MSWPITVVELKDYLGNEKPTVDDAFYQGALDAALETFQDSTQREFTLVNGSTTATSRTFLARDPYVLRIHDCTAVTSVVDNGGTISSGSYQLEPVGVARTGAQRPYEQIRLVGGTWYRDPYLRPTAVVTAKWGWPAIPQRVEEAIKVLAADIVRNRTVQLGVVGFTEAGAFSARTNPIVRSAIEKYMAVEAFGIG